MLASGFSESALHEPFRRGAFVCLARALNGLFPAAVCAKGARQCTFALALLRAFRRGLGAELACAGLSLIHI
eukprot:12988273-Alexandrium_andersonii.AAC.1